MPDELKIEADWDDYWAAKKQNSSNSAYDIIARLYRKFIIKRILNYFIFKHFPKNYKTLHAGCGSGQVDADLIGHMNITALDISKNALKIYSNAYGNAVTTVHGSIFNLPFENETFDGIYNLGVMEHFTETEINAILKEFKRVLKANGKMVILWPPKFGLTVFALDSIHFILNKIFRMKVKLHPDEITRIRSKKHAVELFNNAGFKVVEYYFGIKDVFTQAVIVVQK